MSRVTVKRRPDGIVQIQRIPAWRTLAGPVPTAILGFLVLTAVALVGLATALIRFPILFLLVGGLVVLMLTAVRYALHDRQPALRAPPPVHRPPLDAA
jgi:hypothetical protein